MKNRIMILAMVAVTLLFAGCQKEDVLTNGQLKLKAEGYGFNTKVAVDGGSSVWVTGDSVLINGDTALVQVSGSEARVSGLSPITSPFYGVYPARICSEYGATCTLNIPAQYTYAVSDGKQILRSPMVAYASGGDELFFKHVTAAIVVEITNDFGIDVKVTNITISSNKYKLNGSTAVTVGSTIIMNPVVENENAALRQVQMTFGGTALNIASGNTAQVQVPVLPVGSDNRFTISVTVQNKDDADMVYTFTKTQGSSQGDYSLGRAQLGYAPAKFGGVFSVATNKQVRFAPGNLQYQASTDTWRFAKNQWDCIGPSNSSISDNYSGWIDLFGWGTGNNPTLASTEDSDYNSFNDWGASASANIGSGWYTMRQGQWDTIVFYRSVLQSGLTGTNGTSARFGLSKIEDQYVLVIYPDSYVHPAGAGQPSSQYNGLTTSYAKTLSADTRIAMEAAGAVFLPYAGYRNGTSVSSVNSYGEYWMSTAKSQKEKYKLQLKTYSCYTNNVASPTQGFSVRLVRDVQ